MFTIITTTIIEFIIVSFFLYGAYQELTTLEGLKYFKTRRKYQAIVYLNLLLLFALAIYVWIDIYQHNINNF